MSVNRKIQAFSCVACRNPTQKLFCAWSCPSGPVSRSGQLVRRARGQNILRSCCSCSYFLASSSAASPQEAALLWLFCRSRQRTRAGALSTGCVCASVSRWVIVSRAVGRRGGFASLGTELSSPRVVAEAKIAKVAFGKDK